MKTSGFRSAVVLLLLAAPLLSQEPPQPVAVSGILVTYDPGRTLVLRDASGRETGYALAPGVAVPRDLAINRTVTIFVTPADGGPPAVSRVVLGAGASEAPPAPEPSPAPTATPPPPPPSPVAAAPRETQTSPAAVPRAGIASGTVSGYVAGKAIAIRVAGGRELTFYLDPKAPIPRGLRVGSRVTMETEPLAGSSESIVRRVEEQPTRRR